MTSHPALLKLSTIDELFHDDFCPCHGYLCSTQIRCWQDVLEQGDVIVCDETEDDPEPVEPGEVG